MILRHHVCLLLIALVGPVGRIVLAAPSRTRLLRRDTTMNVTLVRDNAVLIATRSWELGTLAEALIELEYPSLSVFTDTLETNVQDVYPQDVVNIAISTLASKPMWSLALVSTDTAVGDPCSIGPAMLLANWTFNDNSFGDAAYGQLEYLLSYAPRASSGAISQRTDQVQLWADFLAMAPPFVAYYGALQNSLDLLNQAYTQIQLYRDELFDADGGLWRHVALGDWQDTNHWATGNAWAAFGMLRVLMTIQRSSQASSLLTEQSNLQTWINDTLNGVWAHQQASGALLNYIDADSTTTFTDASATALLAAATFRFATLTGDQSHAISAANAYYYVQSCVDANGWLWGTADVLTFSEPSGDGVASPEGQSFVLLMQVAYDAWRTALQQGIANGIGFGS